MSLYNPSEINLPIKTRILLLLQKSDSRFVLQNVLDVVFWNLLVQAYPLEEPYRWLSKSEDIPADLHQEKERYFDRRSLCYWFWDELGKIDYGSPQQRLPRGSKPEHLIDHVLAELTSLPFLNAVSTWLAVCEEYLQVCNIDWYVAQDLEELRIWKDGEEKDIPKYLAGMMALIYY